MKIEANSVDEYISKLPEDRREVLTRLRRVINDHIPEGFEERLIYGMPGWVVPHSIYPDGYHVKPELPLPFINIASQKNFVALYHSGIYSSPELLQWWQEEYPKHAKRKLDMGKSCVRMKKMDDIPYDLIGELAGKLNVEQWIELYERARGK